MFWKRRVYLDYAACLPVDMAGNPSSPHEEGRQAKKMLEDARVAIARLVEVKSDDVVFTSGATEANALAILGYVRAVRKSQRNNVHVLYLPSAHASIIENMHLLAEEGVVIESLPIVEGSVDIEALEKMITPNTILVSMDAVCGETGVVWNTREVAEVLKRFRTNALKKESAQAARPIQHSFFNASVLHVDASQAPLTEKITRSHFGADMLTFDGSKVGARGIGALIAHRTIPIEPLYRGGGQERGLRPGSESPESASLFATALTTAVQGREAFCVRADHDRLELTKTLRVLVPDAFINEGISQAPNILNISFPGRDTDYLVALLDNAGFAVSSRSACETDSEERSREGSRAVLALTGDTARAKSTLRISWGPHTKMRDLTRLTEALAQVIHLC